MMHAVVHTPQSYPVVAHCALEHECAAARVTRQVVRLC
jgi:hypothetical protein